MICQRYQPELAVPTVSASLNYILGSCPNPSCARIDGHVAATDIPDDFATELLQKLRPAITEFMTNGAPRRPKRRRRE